VTPTGARTRAQKGDVEMIRKTSWLLVAVFFVAVLAFQPAGSEAALPERWSIVFVDAGGSLIECIDFGRCGGTICPAYAFFAGRAGKCDAPVEEFELGRTRLSSCSWRNIDWSFFAPNTKEVVLDVTCTRWGMPYFWFGFFESPPPFSCGAGVTYRRVDQFGFNSTMNEGYSGITIGNRMSCGQIFGALSAPQIESFDIDRYLRRRPR
jgi:hypothetical protein